MMTWSSSRSKCVPWTNLSCVYEMHIKGLYTSVSFTHQYALTHLASWDMMTWDSEGAGLQVLDRVHPPMVMKECRLWGRWVRMGRRWRLLWNVFDPTWRLWSGDAHLNNTQSAHTHPVGKIRSDIPQCTATRAGVGLGREKVFGSWPWWDDGMDRHDDAAVWTGRLWVLCVQWVCLCERLGVGYFWTVEGNNGF